MEKLIYDPLLPPPLLAALWALACAACLVYIAWRPTRIALPRRMLLAVLHFLPFAAVLFILHRPTWVRYGGEEGKRPILSVLVDSSASMAAEDAGAGRSRYAAARQIVDDCRRAWNADFELRLSSFDKMPKPWDEKLAQPNGSVTNIEAAVEAAAKETPTAALALVLTDGIHNAASSDLVAAARSARAAGLPVYTHTLGSNLTVRDIGVVLSNSEELAFVRQRARIPVNITQIGYDNTEVEIHLMQGLVSVEKKKVRFEAGTPEVVVDFFVTRDDPGLYTYEVGIKPQKGEAITTNNYRRMSVRVVNERVRILLAEGKPYWDSKFLVRLLRRDPNVLLSTATHIRADKIIIEPPSPEDGDGKQKVPPLSPPRDPRHPLEDRSFLAQFQVLMLGRDADAFLTVTAIENVRDWVSRSGGHLVCTRGRPMAEQQMSTAMAAMLPVSWKQSGEKKIGVNLTERGRALALFEASDAKGAWKDDPEVLLKSLPSLVTATSIDKERSLTVVLARTQTQENDPMAVLSVQAYGSGKCIVMEGQGMWRWAFRPPGDDIRGEDIYRAFWSNMTRWLAGSSDFLPSQAMALRAGKPLYHSGERPVLYVMLKEAENADKNPATPKDKTPAVSRIDIVRQEPAGGLDKTFQKLSVVSRPMPRDPAMQYVELPELDEGHYQARLANIEPPVEAAFEVLPPLREKFDMRARPEAMAQFSKLTDARALEFNELKDLGKVYGEYIKRNKPSQEIKRPAWDSPYLLLALFAWMTATWTLRRRWGAI